GTQRRLHTRLAGAGIGVTGVDQQVARGVGQVLLAQGHRGGAEGVGGEHTGDAGVGRRLHDHYVLAAGPLDPGASNTKAKPGNRVKSRERTEADGHERNSRNRMDGTLHRLWNRPWEPRPAAMRYRQLPARLAARFAPRRCSHTVVRVLKEQYYRP